MRAGKIFIESLIDLGLLGKVAKLKIGLFGSLAATGKGHLTPEGEGFMTFYRSRCEIITDFRENLLLQAVMMGLQGSDPETIE